MPDRVVAQERAALGGIGLTARLTLRQAVAPADAAAAVAADLDAAMLDAAQAVIIPALKAALAFVGPPASLPHTAPHQRPAEEHQKATRVSGLPPLHESVVAQPGRDGGVDFGSVNKYGAFLELGTQEMAPRPWVFPTLQRPDVRRAFELAVVAALARRAAASGAGQPSGPPPGAPGTA